MGAGDSGNLHEELAAIASPERGEAAGFTAALACAQAAALVELTATLASGRLGSDEMAALAAEAAQVREHALELAGHERTAWTDARASGRPELASEPARRIAELAGRTGEAADAVVAAGDWPFTPDARAAAELAGAAGTIAGLVLAANREPSDGA
ncbi:MAG: hypothetical protein ACKOFC_04370 [Solirubrobacterales bacterium]